MIIWWKLLNNRLRRHHMMINTKKRKEANKICFASSTLSSLIQDLCRCKFIHHQIFSQCSVLPHNNNIHKTVELSDGDETTQKIAEEGWVTDKFTEKFIILLTRHRRRCCLFLLCFCPFFTFSCCCCCFDGRGLKMMRRKNKIRRIFRTRMR